MTEPLEVGFCSNSPEAETTPQETLESKKSLLHQPLGQKLLSPKFLSPLGEKSLLNIDNAGLLGTEVSDGKTPDSPPRNTRVKSSDNSSDMTNIQAKTDEKAPNNSTKIPQLDTVIQNISIVSPLSQQQDFLVSEFPEKKATTHKNKPVSVSPLPSVQKKNSPSQQLQRKPSQDIPTSWSNIAELVGESSTVNDNEPLNEPLVVQPLGETRHQDKGFKSLTSYPKSGTTNQGIQAYRKSSDKTSAAMATDNGNANEEFTFEQPLSADEIDNLEVLAQEIYQKLRQRLEIEQERRGKSIGDWGF